MNEYDDDESILDDDGYCKMCGELIGSGSHWHCVNCGEVCSSMGHANWKEGGYTCERKPNMLNTKGGDQ